MARMEAGHTFGGRVAKALGLSGRCIENIVIEIPARGIVKVYVKESLDRGGNEIVQAIEDASSRIDPVFVSTLEVNEQGGITAVK